MSSTGPKCTIAELARLIEGEIVPGCGFTGEAVSTVAFNSGEAAPCSAFVCIRGSVNDGHAHIPQAFERGAIVAIVSDREALAGSPGIAVSDTRAALSRLAARFFGPACHPDTIAVTGTNGKTTVNWLIFSALARLGSTPLRIGTLGAALSGGFDEPGNLTTPDPIALHKTIARGVEGGADICVIEASSHALDQRRVDDLSLRAGIFTNLTRDHLDYHGSMENYWAAKRRLFDLVARHERGAAVVNTDDVAGERLVGELASSGLKLITYGTYADVSLAGCRSHQTGSTVVLRFEGRSFEIDTGLVGPHNGGNLAAAFGACAALGHPPDRVAEALTGMTAPPGRLEVVEGPGFAVYVDYAHTPDALERVLSAVREITPGRVAVVFGCGGDRDRGKRPEMGAVAAKLADTAIVTTDNPRNEDPGAIIDEIVAGMNGAEFVVEPDRRRAIERAVRSAGRGDSVIVAGKGHEPYQIVGSTRHHFSDSEEVRRALGAKG